ncbi:MAG: gamma carbonic anhydrase family protein [Candidatus Saliniplasma sp.]
MTDELEEFLPKEKAQIDDSAFLDPTARIVGNVMVSNNSSLWPGSVLDGKKSKIDVGENSIIMNNATIKGTEDNLVKLGKNSFISPGARIKGSKIGKNVLVGLDAVVMEDAEIGEGSIIGTDTIVPQGMKIPDNSIVRGRPAEIVGEVDQETLEELDEIRDHMFKKRDEYKIMMKRGEEYDIFDTPKRPNEILESKKEELFSDEDQEEIDKKMKKVLSKIDSEDYY